MRRCRSLLAGALVLGTGTAAFAAAYAWTGSGDGVSWNDGDNWYGICGTPPCFPRTTSDDATIITQETIDINENSTPLPYEIDDLYLYATNAATDLTLADGEGRSGGPTTLVVDMWTLYGVDQSPNDQQLVVVFTEGARITN